MPTIQSTALTTVARAKIFLTINTDKYDGLLTMLINQATGFIERYVGRSLKEATFTNEVYDGTGSNTLILKQFPITSITSIQVRNTPDNTDSWTTINSQYYHFDPDSGVVTYLGGAFIEGPRMYRVTYVAGYKIDFNNEADTSLHTLPMQIEYACHKLVSAIFNARKGMGLSSEKVGDLSVSYNKEIMTDSELKGILDLFKAPTL